ncbi:MAG TPA: hypothetical protein VFF06_11555 [Polyangia bacterium]|nr:hypothetical protein [Polyangia bacterium]
MRIMMNVMLVLSLAGLLSSCGDDVSIADMPAGNVDLSGTSGDGPGGGKMFGDLCSSNADCQSGLCEPFAMMAVHRCTKSCTVATQATDCPAPSNGTCTPNNYCRFLQ